jgi:AraC family transcriptional regulator, melibiose operon regulatory protein
MKVKSNDCIVIMPGAIHNIYLNRKESCKMIDMIFKPGIAPVLGPDAACVKQLRFVRELEDKKIQYFRFSDNRGFKNLLEGIGWTLKRNGENSGDYSSAGLKLDLCKMVLLFSEILDEIRYELGETENAYIKAAKRYFLENYRNAPDIEELSKSIGISSRHLSRLFNKESGMSAQDYIMILRLDKARELLENSDMNITEIAFYLGFGSSDYFTSFFKKHEGISPRAFRQKMQRRPPLSADVPPEIGLP